MTESRRPLTLPSHRREADEPERGPDFEMTYSPERARRTKFKAPAHTRWPSIAYLVGSLVLSALVLDAYLRENATSRLFLWVVAGDRARPIPAGVLAVVILVSAIATVLRAQMRGVLVSDQWVEARTLLALGIPRSRRWAWPQVNRVVVDNHHVWFELWDGQLEQLPDVAESDRLVALILEHARSRRIDVTWRRG